jgi:hypothetical protein
MRESKVIGGIAALVTCGAGLVILFSVQGGFGPSFDAQPHQATGVAMAQQALALLKPGGQLTVIARDTSTFKNPAAEVQLASFRKTLAKVGAKIAVWQALQVDPLRLVEVPAGDFLELLRKTPPGNVIVSFMGPPMLSEEQRLKLPETKAAVVAFCSGSLPERVDLRPLFEQGLLQAAIVSKPNVSAGPRPASLQQCFDDHFMVVTPSNLASLPTQASTSQ